MGPGTTFTLEARATDVHGLMSAIERADFAVDGTPPTVTLELPAFLTGAHNRTMGWWETYTQAADFLTPGSEGQVIHYCGSAACSFSGGG